jgi:hypothetical protein
MPGFRNRYARRITTHSLNLDCILSTAVGPENLALKRRGIYSVEGDVSTIYCGRIVLRDYRVYRCKKKRGYFDVPVLESSNS